MSDSQPLPVDHFLPLSPQTFHVLVALADEDRHGYAIATEVERGTGGAVQLAAGTLYGILKRCTEEGLVREVDGPRDLPGGERRRYYRLTELGRRVAGAEARRLESLVGRARAKDLLQPEGGR